MQLHKDRMYQPARPCICIVPLNIDKRLFDIQGQNDVPVGERRRAECKILLFYAIAMLVIVVEVHVERPWSRDKSIAKRNE